MKIGFVLFSFAILGLGAGCAVDAQDPEVGTQRSALTEGTDAAVDPPTEEPPSDDMMSTGLKDCGGLHQGCLSGCRMNRNTNCRADCDKTFTDCQAGRTGVID